MDKLIAFYDKLTLGKVLLAIVASAAYIFLYAMWEQRSAVFITITGNVAAMVSIAVGFGLLLISGVAVMIVKVFDSKTSETIKVLTDRVADGEKTIQLLKDEVNRLQTTLTQAVKDERDQCDKRMVEMRDSFERLLRSRTRP